MITKVVIRNFKRFQQQVFDDLGQLHLLVGQNNSGKSTLLHALAIWNYCIEEFRASDRKGETAMEISLANFTPLPLPDFKQLWHNTTERKYVDTGEVDAKTGKPTKKQEFIYIEIEVTWTTPVGAEHTFAVKLRRETRSSMYAQPVGGWEPFRKLDANGDTQKTVFPKIVYVPPASNIAAVEKWTDEPNIRAAVGEGRPGSVVRNMLLRAHQAENSGVGNESSKPRWHQKPFTSLKTHIRDWFGIAVNEPIYKEGRSRFITSTYDEGLEWVNVGSGTLQSLIVLSFLYGFEPDVFLLDEPDAHLHVNLQRTMLEFLKQQTATQMLIATHAEEFIKRVDATQISYLTPYGVRKVPQREDALLALSEISNLDLLNLVARKVIVYVEGETDEELIRGWTEVAAQTSDFAGLREVMDRIVFWPLKGGGRDDMMQKANRHFRASQFLGEEAKRVLLLDRNDGKWEGLEGQVPGLHVWRTRQHIEGYLILPKAWKRAARAAARERFPLAEGRTDAAVDDFFHEQGFAENIDWLSTSLPVLQSANAKELLFDARRTRSQGYDSLTARLYDMGVALNRRDIALCMKPDELHADVKAALRLILAAGREAGA